MKMTNPASIKGFALAGKATLTLKSLKSGTHFTYKIRKPKKDDKVRFVSLLVAPETYAYIGMIKDDHFTLTRKSKMGVEAPSVRAVTFFCDKVLADGTIPEALEVRHEGRCGRCNRELTHPDSIDRGIGPECWKYVGG